jgi:diguanylate cyclase (GGDEF)-like protein
MKKIKDRTQQKVATEQSLNVNKAVVLNREEAVEAREKAADAREEAVDAREKAADIREGAVDVREGSADVRQEAADSREEAADVRQEAADVQEGSAEVRQEAADVRQEAADVREEAADVREEAADVREETALRAQKMTKEQLLEANERLIVAMVSAQTMADAALQANEQILYMAEHDFLTGLPNRVLLSDRLAQSITLAQRYGNKVALMYLDLDNFKHVNDSLGHEVGDQLLQSVAKCLQASVRLSDTVCRQGGDEFMVLLPEVGKVQDVALIAEKLIEAMARPHIVGNHLLHVTMSIGISIYPDNGMNIETLFKNADTAMYHSKNNGRNNYQVFTPDMNVRAVARQSIEVALHQALKQREFLLHYQPKVNLESGAIIGAEALIRWHRSDGQLVSPAEFVPIAEECGLILPIGKWVLREACCQTQAWLKAGLNLEHVAVNISTKELRDKDFLAGVHTILNDTGLDPHKLELELTESVLMNDTKPTMVILHALKDLGVQIAVDDFGTGYSSLSYLRHFPIDALKIDQSFVKDIDCNGGEAIVSAVIAMGRSLKHRVVAEGIETRQQLVFLKSQRCAEGQGYYFGRPMVADNFAVFHVDEQARRAVVSDE